MSFKENLKAELVFSGMLVKELARRSGIKKNTIDNYLNVKNRIPSAENAVRIAKVLGVSVEYLVTGSGAQSRPAQEGASQNVCPEARAVARLVGKLEEKNRKIVLSVAKALNAYEISERNAISEKQRQK
jgi:transcriptional regulator with XRE-family HTH domain